MSDGPAQAPMFVLSLFGSALLRVSHWWERKLKGQRVQVYSAAG